MSRATPHGEGQRMADLYRVRRWQAASKAAEAKLQLGDETLHVLALGAL